MRTYTELARLPCHGHERKPCSAITLNPLLTVLSTRGLGRLRRFRQEVRQPQLLLLREGRFLPAVCPLARPCQKKDCQGSLTVSYLYFVVSVTLICLFTIILYILAVRLYGGSTLGVPERGHYSPHMAILTLVLAP